MARPEIGSLAEQLAEKVHEAWMEQRRLEGWTYGKTRSDVLKQHPCFLSYALLPEIEKEIDRKVARTCIQGLLGLGYEIGPHEAGSGAAAAEDPVIQTLRRRLVTRSQMPLDLLQATWRQCRTVSHCPADVHLKLGEEILKRGEPILAYDVLSRGISAARTGPDRGRKPKDLLVRLTQLSALALAQSGATGPARGALVELCKQGEDNPETLGLLGRVYKDLAAREPTRARRRKLLGQALLYYKRGLEKSEALFKTSAEPRHGEDAYYCGINAAALTALLNQIHAAKALAARVREICETLIRETRSAGVEDSYWLLATLGEAELMAGRLDEAREWYRAAVKRGAGNWRDLSSTRRQARLLAAHLNINSAEWDPLFPNISVIVFGCRRGCGTPPALPAKEAVPLKRAMDRGLKESGAIAGYIGDIAPAQLLFAEALIEAGAEAHLILPYERQSCCQELKSLPGWVKRFNRLLERAASVTEDTQRSCLDPAVNVGFSSLRAYGSGWLRARSLDAELHLWNAPPAGEFSESFLLNHAQKSAPGSGATYRFPGEWGAGKGPLKRRTTRMAKRGGDCRILAMLFADAKDFSKLDDTGLFHFARMFAAKVAQILQQFSGKVLTYSMSGDGCFFVFSDIAAAADAALALLEAMLEASRRKPQAPAIRISLDAGPVHTFRGVRGELQVCGAYVNRAARIEPITPTNSIYASEAFTSLYVASGARGFQFDYVGQTELAKGFGLTPLYSLSKTVSEPGN